MHPIDYGYYIMVERYLNIVNQNYFWLPYDKDEAQQLIFMKSYLTVYLEKFKDHKRKEFSNSTNKDHNYDHYLNLINMAAFCTGKHH